MDRATRQILAKESQAWRRALGCEQDGADARASGEDASWLLGCVHEILPSMILNHASRGNYMRKIYAAVSISLTRSYSHLISLDDDILLPPATLAFMIDETVEPQGAMASTGVSSISQEGYSGGDSTEQSCAVLTPTLSTGIPTVELWCHQFLQPWEKAFVEECFAGSSLADWDGYHEHLSSFKDVPDTLLASCSRGRRATTVASRTLRTFSSKNGPTIDRTRHPPRALESLVHGCCQRVRAASHLHAVPATASFFHNSGSWASST